MVSLVLFHRVHVVFMFCSASILFHRVHVLFCIDSFEDLLVDVHYHSCQDVRCCYCQPDVLGSQCHLQYYGLPARDSYKGGYYALST